MKKQLFSRPLCIDNLSQHTAHSTQHTAHSTQHTAHSHLGRFLFRLKLGLAMFLSTVAFIQVSYSQCFGLFDQCTDGSYVCIGTGTSFTNYTSIKSMIASGQTHFGVIGEFTFNEEATVNNLSFVVKNNVAINVNLAFKKSLTMTNCNFVSCRDLWTGILVKNSSTLIADHCSFSDASYAINVFGVTANINITNCTFLQNLNGIAAGQLDGTGSDCLGKLFIQKCRFFGTLNGLKTGKTAINGFLSAQNNPGLMIDGCLFDGLQNGISSYADLMNLSSNNVFKNMLNVNNTQNLNYSTGRGVFMHGKPNKTPIAIIQGSATNSYSVGPNNQQESENFINCFFGVHFSAAGGTISNSRLNGCAVGIRLTSNNAQNSSTISNNIITSPKRIGIDFNGNGTAYSSSVTNNNVIYNKNLDQTNAVAAIRILATPPFDVQQIGLADNTITMAFGGVGIDIDGASFVNIKQQNVINIGGQAIEYKGIYLHNKTNSTSISGTILNASPKAYNSTTKDRLGIYLNTSADNNISCNHFKGPDRSLNLIGDCDITTIQYNEFFSGTDGLVYGQEPSASVTNSPQIQEGNYWHIPWQFSNASCKNLAGSVDAFLAFPTDVNFNNPFWPDVDNAQLFSEDLDQGFPITSCIPSPTIIQDLTELQTKIVMNNFNGLPTDDNYKRSNYWRLFDKIDQNPSLTQNVNVQAFLAIQSATPWRQLYNINKAFNASAGMDSTTQSSLNSIDAQKTSLYADLNPMLLQWASTPSDSVLSNNIDLKVAQIQSLDSNAETIRTTWYNALLQTYTSSLSSLSNISAVHLMDVNMKSVLAIYMRVNVQPNAVLDSTTIVQLQSIANMCTIDGGLAVLMARNILKTNGIVTLLEDSNNCNPLPIVIKDNNTKTELIVKTYPNPVVDKLFIEYPQDSNLDEVFNLKITDIMGNIKFQQNGVSSMNAIDVSLYPSGLYYLNVKNTKGSYSTKTWIKN